MKKLIAVAAAMLALAGGIGAATLATTATVPVTITIPYTVGDQTGVVTVSKDVLVPVETQTFTETVTQTVTVTQPTTITEPPPTTTQPPSPPPSDFPDASNTGVPAGTTLTAYTGPSRITTPNTVISGKTMGCIQVSAPGVVIKNSKITCRNDYAVYVDDRTSSSTVVTIQDSEIDCGNSNGTALGEADITARRLNIHGCENGLDVNQNVTLEDSYIHDLYNGGGAHMDGIQLSFGHWNGSSYPCCALNVTIRHNTIYAVDSSGALGTSAVISNPRGDVNILIENNLLAGGAYTLYCDYNSTATNYRVTGNHFSTKFSPKVGAYGASTGCADETQTGNVIHETGQPLSLD